MNLEKPTKYSVTGNLVMLNLIEPDAAVGSIIIPESARNRERLAMNEGIVLECGEDCRLGLKPGDMVCFQPHTEFRLEHDGRPFVLVNEQHIILVQKK